MKSGEVAGGGTTERRADGKLASVQHACAHAAGQQVKSSNHSQKHDRTTDRPLAVLRPL